MPISSSCISYLDSVKWSFSVCTETSPCHHASFSMLNCRYEIALIESQILRSSNILDSIRRKDHEFWFIRPQNRTPINNLNQSFGKNLDMLTVQLTWSLAHWSLFERFFFEIHGFFAGRRANKPNWCKRRRIVRAEILISGSSTLISVAGLNGSCTAKRRIFRSSRAVVIRWRP